MSRHFCMVSLVMFLCGCLPAPSLDERLKSLENRVEDLRKEVGDLRTPTKPTQSPALDNKLIGSWSVVQGKKNGLTGLRLEVDGTFEMTGRGNNLVTNFPLGRYRFVGKVLILENGSNPGNNQDIEVVSVTEKELVLSISPYFGEKEEYKLERQ